MIQRIRQGTPTEHIAPRARLFGRTGAVVA